MCVSLTVAKSSVLSATAFSNVVRCGMYTVVARLRESLSSRSVRKLRIRTTERRQATHDKLGYIKQGFYNAPNHTWHRL